MIKNIKATLIIACAMVMVPALGMGLGKTGRPVKPAATSPAAHVQSITSEQQKTLDSLLQNMGNAQIKVFAHDDMYRKQIDVTPWDQLINKIKAFVIENAAKNDQSSLLTIGFNPILMENTHLLNAIVGAQKAFANHGMTPAMHSKYSAELANVVKESGVIERNLKNAGFQTAGSQMAQTALENIAIYIGNIAQEANNQLTAKFNALKPAAPARPAKVVGAKKTVKKR